MAAAENTDQIIAKITADMNNPNFVESMPTEWNRPAVPPTNPSPYFTRTFVSVPPNLQSIIEPYLDLNEITTAVAEGSDCLNLTGKSALGAIGMSLFSYFDDYYKTIEPLPAVTGREHIAGGVLPGNGGANVHGPLASLITPTQLALSGSSLFIADTDDNRIRVVDIVTGKVNNITVPIGGVSTTSIEVKIQLTSAGIRTFMAAGGQTDSFNNHLAYDPYYDPASMTSQPPTYYTANLLANVTPYKSERGLENVPANRTGIVKLQAMAASQDGTVYFSDFVDEVYSISASAIVNASTTRYTVASTTGFEVGRAVTISGININFGFNGQGIIQSFDSVAKTVIVNIASSGSPGTDWSIAYLFLESRLRQIPKMAY